MIARRYNPPPTGIETPKREPAPGARVRRDGPKKYRVRSREFVETVYRMKATGLTPRQIAAAIDRSLPTVYDILRTGHG